MTAGTARPEWLDEDGDGQCDNVQANLDGEGRALEPLTLRFLTTEYPPFLLRHSAGLETPALWGFPVAADAGQWDQAYRTGGKRGKRVYWTPCPIAGLTNTRWTQQPRSPALPFTLY